VASIRVSVRQGRRCVIIRGSLTATDLGRLERACGPALEQRDLALDIALVSPWQTDEAAKLFLQGLVRRGAVLTEQT